jgi:hypothetical protein
MYGMGVTHRNRRAVRAEATRCMNSMHAAFCSWEVLPGRRHMQHQHPDTTFQALACSSSPKGSKHSSPYDLAAASVSCHAPRPPRHHPQMQSGSNPCPRS